MGMNADASGSYDLVRTWMATQLITVSPDDNLALASQMMLWGGFHHLPVTHNGELVGLLSDRDLMGQDRRQPVSAVMSTDLLTAAPDEELSVAAERMATTGINCLPVLGDGKLVGLVTTTDVLLSHSRPRLSVALGDAPVVRSIMQTEPIRFAPDDKLISVVIRMIRENIRHAPVVDDHDRLLGMISDRDLRVALGDPTNLLDKEDLSGFEEARAEHVMSRRPFTIGPDAPIQELSSYFLDERIGAMAVVKNDKLIGIVSYIDLVAALLGR